ncbi:MAG: hypothetical protein WB947_08305 [Thermoplasmata archaeon]
MESSATRAKVTVCGSKTVGRDVKKGLGRAGTKLNAGARTLGRDVRITDRKARDATKRGWARAGKRLKRKRSA